MSHLPNVGLTFNVLRSANLARLPQFKNRQGQLAHTEPDGSDWSKSEWLQATVGELGELANLLKKVRRGDLTLDEAMPEIRKEFADVQIYLDIFAKQFDINLGQAVIEKFNEVSKRVSANVFIYQDGSDWRTE